MSDDEFYDDEYADFHDMLYDADPDPDLADDLAEHAAYSPVYFDNPNEEAREYFSDWEYYSDDYFDDDPVLLGTITNTQGDTEPQSQRKKQLAKRGRKRKLSEARESVVLNTNEIGALKACMRGTVWKTASPEPMQIYKKDLADPVALRLSKAIMKSAYSKKQGFGKGRLRRDESWANELSLADMGLRNEKGIDVHLGAENAEGEEEVDEVYEDVEDVDEAMDEEVGKLQDIEDVANLSFERLAMSKSTSDEYTRKGLIEGSDEEAHASRKRRKVIASESSTETKDTPNTPETSYSSDDLAANMEIGLKPDPPKESSGRGRGRLRKQPSTTQEHKAQSVSIDAAIVPTRKRRISSVESSATASTASTRAKRIATDNAVSKSEEGDDLVAKSDKQKTRKLRESTLRKSQRTGDKK